MSDDWDRNRDIENEGQRALMTCLPSQAVSTCPFCLITHKGSHACTASRTVQQAEFRKDPAAVMRLREEAAAIVSSPAVRFGKPTIAGRRITPWDVIGRIESGETPRSVQRDFDLRDDQMALVTAMWEEIRDGLLALGWRASTRGRRR